MDLQIKSLAVNYSDFMLKRHGEKLKHTSTSEVVRLCVFLAQSIGGAILREILRKNWTFLMQFVDDQFLRYFGTQNIHKRYNTCTNPKSMF